MFDPKSFPEQSIFSPRETSPEVVTKGSFITPSLLGGGGGFYERGTPVT